MSFQIYMDEEDEGNLVPETPPTEPAQKHDDTVNAILDEMAVVSREEWFEIARRAEVGAGFNPMRQLQLKIRHNPLNFGPALIAIIFQTKEVLERVIPWPKSKWPLAQEYQPAGFIASKGIDMFPYQTLDPYVDNLDRAIDEHGLKDARTVHAARLLVESVKGFDPDSRGKQNGRPGPKARRKARNKAAWAAGKRWLPR